MPITAGESLVESAKQKLSRFENCSVADRSRKILSLIADTLSDRDRFANLPPFNAFPAEDGSVLIEWIFPYLRLGFSIEPDPKESAWYLTSNSITGRISASGPLDEEHAVSTIEWLITFVLAIKSYTANDPA